MKKNILSLKAYSEKDNLPFFVKYGVLIGFLLLFPIILIEFLSGTKFLLTILTLLILFFMGFILLVKEFNSTILIDLRKEKVIVKQFGKNNIELGIDSAFLSVEYSTKSDNMEYCLHLPVGKFFIPQYLFINSSKNIQKLTKIVKN